MTSLIDELEGSLSDGDQQLSDLIPSAINLATMLRHRALSAWLRIEFEGFAHDAELPIYRARVPGHIMARSPQYGWIPAPIDESLKHEHAHTEIRYSVADIERTCMNCKKGRGIQLSLPEEQLGYLQSRINLKADLAITINRTSFCQILKVIRGSIYLWVRDVKALGIGDASNSFTDADREIAAFLDDPEKLHALAFDTLDKLPLPEVRQSNFLERLFSVTAP
ncbi:hypothetical protein CKO35_06695 [Ectothiorhodospira shaposhnikovii]|uniref:AbiTii domain-containing protein n=1 Tax=Ectothiorhodospira shaposhnikovii TaxID=1054 RepID=UPI001903D964|nr:hypothetical protein [Ectothiorhodospira shaposhnikovii]MBK1672997.1 hypothetical protein [Ectothiorhodospira shaposhnikovii]